MENINIKMGPWTVGFGLVISTILAFCVSTFVGVLFLIPGIWCISNMMDVYNSERRIKTLEEIYKNTGYENGTENS